MKKYLPTTWGYSEWKKLRDSNHDKEKSAIIFCVIVLAFLLELWILRGIQDQQALILAYEEAERANLSSMYCVWSDDTLTIK